MDDDRVLDAPDLLPLRMLNESVYCPRLLHLEWVQQEWADNLDTDEGTYVHRRVDAGGGAAPDPELAALRAARSVLLSDPKLGLVAKVDLLEGEGDRVRVVEVKRGKPAPTPERIWEPELLQLAAQVMLVRRTGYRCDEGIVYFAAARTRVPVIVDEDLERRVLDAVAEARQIAARPEPPPPLVDSPKCPRCSLVSICLPDEVNTLAKREPRRALVPRRGAARPLYVSEQGARIGVSRGRVTVRRKDEELASLRLIDVSQVVLHGNVHMSAQAMQAMFRADVPVLHLSYGGWLRGMSAGTPSNNIEIRRRQVLAAEQRAIEPARAFVAGKIANQRTLLRRNARGDVARTVAMLKDRVEQASEVESIGGLLGVEGTAARLYFAAFTAMLRDDLRLPGSAFDMDGRNRRPPKDAVNALLSFVYALLVKDVTATCWGVGLDPYLGFLHRPRFGRPALALDLAEEFRALVGDSTVIQVINNGEVDAGSFVVRAGGVALTKRGRRSVIAAYERRLDVELTHPVFGYRVTYRRLLEMQARLLASWLLGDFECYEPVVTR